MTHARILLAVLLIPAGCGEPDKPRTPQPRGSATALTQGQGGPNAGGGAPVDENEGNEGAKDGADDPEFEQNLEEAVGDGKPSEGPLFEATYRVKVEADVFGGVTVCDGTVDMKINGDMTFDIPSSTVVCGGLCSVDMKALLATFSSGEVGKAASGKAALDALEGDKKFVRLKELGGATFTPPRPIMLLSPLYLKNPADAQGYSETYSGRLENPKTGERASGTIRVQVTEANAQRVAWNMQAQGWESAPRRAFYGLVKRLEITWGLEPLGIPHIGVIANVGDIMKSSDGRRLDPAQLTKVCAGQTGQVLGKLAGFLTPDDDRPGLLDGLAQSVASNIDSRVSIDLIKQKILGNE